MKNLRKLAAAALLLFVLGVPALADGGITASDSWFASDGGITANDSWLTLATTVTVVSALP